MNVLTIKIDNSQNLNFLVELLSKFSFVEEIKTMHKTEVTSYSAFPIRLPSGQASIDDFAGLWQEAPKTLEQIRQKAWKRTM